MSEEEIKEGQAKALKEAEDFQFSQPTDPEEVKLLKKPRKRRGR